MSNVIERIPESLYENLSKKLIEIVLSTKDKNAVSTDLAKKIIYLWRQDQLATETGIQTMIEAASKVDAEATYLIFDELGLQEVTVQLKSLQEA